jgi:hypothetical protein
MTGSAVSIIGRYACGVAIGMGGSLFRSGTDRPGGESGLWGCEVLGQSIAAIMAATASATAARAGAR